MRSDDWIGGWCKLIMGGGGACVYYRIVCHNPTRLSGHNQGKTNSYDIECDRNSAILLVGVASLFVSPFSYSFLFGLLATAQGGLTGVLKFCDMIPYIRAPPGSAFPVIFMLKLVGIEI